MRNILIVDDMAILREPIASTLQQNGYTTMCAANGQQAIDILEKMGADLLLLDLSMPVMDGLTCLRHIRKDPKFCDLPVILLTENSDRAHVAQAAKIGVNGYMLKSQVSLKELLARVEQQLGAVSGKSVAPAAVSSNNNSVVAPAPKRAVRPPAAVQTPLILEGAPDGRVSAESILARIGEEFRLEGMPPVLHYVLNLINSNETSMDDIAKAIRMDQALALRVMKVANSSFYGNGKHARNLSEVAQRIGITGVRNIVMTVVAMGQISDAEHGGLVPQRFWEHSMATAVLSQLLAQTVVKEEAEQLYLAGLLHDFGRLVLCRLFPDKYAAVLKIAAEKRLNVDAVEKESLGVTHADVTRQVLTQWKLPQKLIDAASLHNFSASAIKSKRRDPRGALVVALANGLAHAMACGDSGADTLLPIHDYANALGLDRSLVEEVTQRGICGAEDSELVCASQSSVGFRSPLYVELFRQTETDVKMAIVANPNRCDPVTLFFGRSRWVEPDRPCVAFVYVADPFEAAERFVELNPLDKQFGGPIPVVLGSPSGGVSLPADIATGRQWTTVPIPGQYSDIVNAVVHACRKTRK